jgi:hypothetical protein
MKWVWGMILSLFSLLSNINPSFYLCIGRKTTEVISLVSFEVAVFRPSLFLFFSIYAPGYADFLRSDLGSQSFGVILFMAFLRFPCDQEPITDRTGKLRLREKYMEFMILGFNNFLLSCLEFILFYFI